jgi:GNAT superfamily N-acetyltransferase
MPEIEIRPAISSDILKLVKLDQTYTSDFSWQMDVSSENSKIGVTFRQIHLPRTLRVEYPRSSTSLMNEWTKLDGLLVAILDSETVAYVSLKLDLVPFTTWLSDLVVNKPVRRQGIGSALVLAAEEWAMQHDSRRIIIEMQLKNYPASKLAQKLGFDFCGYNDRYYANYDMALFFAKSLR